MAAYTFFNNDRIGADAVDNTQRNMENMRYSNYMLSNLFVGPAENGHVDFATQQPNVMFSGAATGPGLTGSWSSPEVSLPTGAPTEPLGTGFTPLTNAPENWSGRVPLESARRTTRFPTLS